MSNSTNASELLKKLGGNKTPKKETPKEEAPKKETPKEETPKEEAPKKEKSGRKENVEKSIGETIEFTDEQFEAVRALFLMLKKEDKDIDPVRMTADDFNIKKKGGKLVATVKKLTARGRKPNDDSIFSEKIDHFELILENPASKNKETQRKYDNMKKLGAKLDVELQKQLKKALRSRKIKLRDAMIFEIEEWLKNKEDFEEKWDKDAERSSNGFMVEEEMRENFANLCIEKDISQAHVLECLMRRAIKRVQEMPY